MRLPVCKVKKGEADGKARAAMITLSGTNREVHDVEFERKKKKKQQQQQQHKNSHAPAADVPHSLGSTVIDSAQGLKPHVSVSHIQSQRGWRHGGETHQRLLR